MRLNVKDISGKWLTVENETARLSLPSEYIIAGTAVYQQSDNKTYVYDGTQWVVLQGDGGGSADLQEALNVTEGVGGVADGKQYATGTSLETIFRDMLNPTLNPEITAPSASIGGGTPYILEVGTTKQVSFTVNFNKGKIRPLYGTEPLVDGDRAGNPTEYKLNNGTAQASNEFSNVTVNSTNRTFSANVKYAASSVQPKDSAGNNYLTPLGEGNVDTPSITYSFTYCVWANDADITSIEKIAPTVIKYSDKEAVFEYPACTGANPEVFDIPSTWTISSIETPSAFIANVWDDVAFEFTSSTTTHLDAAGETVSYTRYTFNKGIAVDGRQIRIKWS